MRFDVFLLFLTYLSIYLSCLMIYTMWHPIFQSVFGPPLPNLKSDIIYGRWIYYLVKNLVYRNDKNAFLEMIPPHCVERLQARPSYTPHFDFIKSVSSLFVKCKYFFIFLSSKRCTAIPRFTLLMWGHRKKNAEAKTT